MARRTATVLNVFLHGVSSEDFDSADQDTLQDVLFDYFADAAPSDKENYSESDCPKQPSASYELTMIERYVELHYTSVQTSRIMTICTYLTPSNNSADNKFEHSIHESDVQSENNHVHEVRIISLILQ